MDIRYIKHIDVDSKYFLYTLRCPKTNIVKYVGITKDPVGRYRKHLNPRSTTLKNNWIKSLKNKGLKPLMVISDSSDTRDGINKKEIYWIIKYREWGFELKNMTSGGDGGDTFTGKKHTDEAKNKISIANKGRKRADVTNVSKRKKVAQIDFNTNEIISVFDSVRVASERTNSSRTNISKMANGTIKPTVKKVGGYVWKYV